MPEIPKEIIEIGGSMVILIWAGLAALNIVLHTVKERRNGTTTGHVDAAERGMMLKAMLRSTEEMKEKINQIVITQAVQTSSMIRIEDRLQSHDTRLREVELTAGRR